MKLSVIIPVYQVEDTLDECIQSVLAQDCDDMEIILVDDASPDHCGEMCEEWCARDVRIHVAHHSENRGLSAARNTGIDRATGEYITFVDSDDLVTPGTYSANLQRFQQAPCPDIVEFPYTDKFGHDKLQHLVTFKDACYTTPLDYWMNTAGHTHTYAWNKIYRSKVFDHHRFPVGRKFEDAHFMGSILTTPIVIATSSQGCYQYRWNMNGITATADGASKRDLLDAYLMIWDKMSHTEYAQRHEELSRFYEAMLNVQLDVNELLGTPPVIPQAPYRKTIKQKILNTLGINTLCKINILLHKMGVRRSSVLS